MGPLRHGPRDPTIRFEGPVACGLCAPRTGRPPCASHLSGMAGASWPGDLAPNEPPTGVPRLLGAEDDPAALVLPRGPLLDLARRLPGLRFGRSDAVLASLVPAIIEQKVTGLEAQRAYRRLVLRYGEPAPGPGGLHLPPLPRSLAGLPYFELHPLGLEQRRADHAHPRRRAGRAARTGGRPATGGRRWLLLRSIPGVGAWTAAETARSAFGDPDAVSVGDFHLPHLVCWALAGEPRGDDARMLELLEPYRGQRARLVRLLELSGIVPPRYGPRMPTRSFERF